MTHHTGPGIPPGAGRHPYGAWGAPRPPRPGVIPLGPLGVADVLGGAFATYRRAWRQLMGMSLLVFGVLALLAGAALLIGAGSVLDFLDEPREEITPASAEEMLMSLLIGLGVIWLVAMCALLLGTSVIQAVCAAVLRGAVLGRSLPFGTVWRETWSRVWAVIGVNLLVSLVTVLPAFVLFYAGWLGLTGSALFAAADGQRLWDLPGWLVPVGLLGGLAWGMLGAWFWVRCSLAPAAAVFEGLGPVTALRRSARLVRGDWWRVFGITLLAAVIAMLAAWVVQLPFQILGLVPSAVLTAGGPDDGTSSGSLMAGLVAAVLIGLLGALVSQTVTSAFTPLVQTLLYVDRRIRTENLAPTLAEAAARPSWPPYGSPARRW
ncbi:hypothetical protein [Streptomyces sp. enrichment culture]|uniref:hypothetical protein n=1 Tax=Streptomyces sp. enrichment culture TaxID=1795815 RepID=UPI003F54CE2D